MELQKRGAPQTQINLNVQFVLLQINCCQERGATQIYIKFVICLVTIYIWTYIHIAIYYITFGLYYTFKITVKNTIETL